MTSSWSGTGNTPPTSPPQGNPMEQIHLVTDMLEVEAERLLLDQVIPLQGGAGGLEHGDNKYYRYTTIQLVVEELVDGGYSWMEDLDQVGGGGGQINPGSWYGGWIQLMLEQQILVQEVGTLEVVAVEHTVIGGTGGSGIVIIRYKYK
jgi:hypothetical protein